ncbi:MAG TPA: hypothetical protein IGS37_05500 [Synechococcales cyanobacterium M55_K2018_004]|nr:hypothetical protein [Synechococcales cyanobacterium M55_K2018_004]
MQFSPLLAIFNPSPFQTHSEFLEVEGPFYTFAHQPGMIAFLLILCALGSIYFVYASFFIKGEQAGLKSPLALSLLLALGLGAVAERVYQQTLRQSDRPTSAVTRGVQMRSPQAPSPRLKPLALLGLVGGSAAASRRRRSSASRQRRIR